MIEGVLHGEHEDAALDSPSTSPATFKPTDRTSLPSDLTTSNEVWTTILETPCTFPPQIFQAVMLNLIRNPNLTSSHLFRADIYFDSDAHPQDGGEKLLQQMKAELRPWKWYARPDWTCTRTIVRELIPRNPSVDKALVQTCQFFSKQSQGVYDQKGQSESDGEEQTLVVYIPHVENMQEMPFYHPEVPLVAFHHTCAPKHPSSLSLSYALLPSTLTSNPKLARTALRLLQTIHKHGQGQLQGYEKRVHHDHLVPQKRYQDTYTRLKTTYGKKLVEQWVEATDPGKHVFEDLGIAAFLIELWNGMYEFGDDESGDGKRDESGGVDGNTQKGKPPFPGFVDIGCGNGLLTFILLSEGYPGWGFDARVRKTWSIFPPSVRTQLHRRLLVPEILARSATDTQQEQTSWTEPLEEDFWHDGVFPPGTFIISNHADELTLWTPLLAYLNASSPFLAIPCCSHDFSGARFRAPAKTKVSRTDSSSEITRAEQKGATKKGTKGPETGSLKREGTKTSVKPGKPPSAYSTLCGYLALLTEEVGFVAEKEVLRIPSTRNHAVVGRRVVSGGRAGTEGEEEVEERRRRRDVVVGLVEREMGGKVEDMGREWRGRCRGLAMKPGSGH